MQIVRPYRVGCAGVLALLVGTLAGAQARQGSGAIVLPSDADIRQVLAERVDALAGQEDGIAIVSWAWSERKVEGLSRAAI
jgi:hypothetical protein